MFIFVDILLAQVYSRLTAYSKQTLGKKKGKTGGKMDGICIMLGLFFLGNDIVKAAKIIADKKEDKKE